jgi:hypothetical protein
MEQQQVKRGRPKLPRKIRKSAYLRVRLTVDELRVVERAAGGRTSAWVREVLLRAANNSD